MSRTDFDAFKHYEAVSFDMDGTLYALDHFKVNLALRRPLDVKWWLAMEKARKALRAQRVQDDDIGLRVQKDMAKALGKPLNKVTQRVAHMIDHDWPAILSHMTPFRRIRPLLGALVAAQIPMIINSDYPGARKAKALGLDGYPWHAIIDATAHGGLKPRPEAFLAAARALNLPPAKILHIGDSPHLDVEGANGVGMGTVLVGRHRPDPQVAAQKPDYQFSSMNQFCDVAIEALKAQVARRTTP